MGREPVRPSRENTGVRRTPLRRCGRSLAGRQRYSLTPALSSWEGQLPFLPIFENRLPILPESEIRASCIQLFRCGAAGSAGEQERHMTVP